MYPHAIKEKKSSETDEVIQRAMKERFMFQFTDLEVWFIRDYH